MFKKFEMQLAGRTLPAHGLYLVEVRYNRFKSQGLSDAEIKDKVMFFTSLITPLILHKS